MYSSAACLALRAPSRVVCASNTSDARLIVPGVPTAFAPAAALNEFCDAALDERSELLLDVRGQWLVVPGACFGEEIIEMLGDDTAEQ